LVDEKKSSPGLAHTEKGRLFATSLSAGKPRSPLQHGSQFPVLAAAAHGKYFHAAVAKFLTKPLTRSFSAAASV